MSAISYVEVFQGVGRGGDPTATRAVLDRLLAVVPILPFSMIEATRCATIREHLLAQGRRVRARELDLMVAATAIEHDLVLVIRNVRDYRDVPNLRRHDIA